MVAFITELNDVNYNQHIKDSKIILVDVWAEWCGPCKMVSPIVDEISIEYRDRLVVGKLDADNNKETLTHLGVRNIPALLLYKDGVIVSKLIGAVSKQKLIDMINAHI